MFPAPACGHHACTLSAVPRDRADIASSSSARRPPDAAAGAGAGIRTACVPKPVLSTVVAKPGHRSASWHSGRSWVPAPPTGRPAAAYNPANADQKAGIDIVRRAIQAPSRQIAQNAGDDGSVVVGKLLEKSDYNWGYNAATGEYQDLVKAGIIDPAKVVRTALQDAASVAGLLITTEALIAEKPKREKAAPAAAPGMGDMDF